MSSLLLFLWLFLSIRFDWSFLSEALLASLVEQWWICASALLIWRTSVEPIIPLDRCQLVTEEGVLLLALMAPRLKVPPQYQPESQLHKWPACHLLSLSVPPPPSRPNCCQMLLIPDLLIDLSHVFKFVISVVMLNRVLCFFLHKVLMRIHHFLFYFKRNDSLMESLLFSFYPVGVSPLKVQMPALSPTMEEGNIVKWLKKEGKINI